MYACVVVEDGRAISVSVHDTAEQAGGEAGRLFPLLRDGCEAFTLQVIDQRNCIDGKARRSMSRVHSAA